MGKGLGGGRGMRTHSRVTTSGSQHLPAPSLALGKIGGTVEAGYAGRQPCLLTSLSHSPSGGHTHAPLCTFAMTVLSSARATDSLGHWKEAITS